MIVAKVAHVRILNLHFKFLIRTKISPLFELTGGEMLDRQSSFPWSTLQWCSGTTEDIQVDHETGRQLNDGQDVGQPADGTILQLQGAYILFYFIFQPITGQRVKQPMEVFFKSIFKFLLSITFMQEKLIFIPHLCIVHFITNPRQENL